MEIDPFIRSIHIISAALWTGLVAYQVNIVTPVVRADPEVGGKFMRHLLLQNKLPRAMLTLSTLTVLAGMTYYARIEAYERDMGSTYGILLNLAVLCGVVAFLIGAFVSFPASRKMRKIVAAPGPPDMAKMAPLAKRLGTGAHVTFGLLMISMVFMTLAPRL